MTAMVGTAPFSAVNMENCQPQTRRAAGKKGRLLLSQHFLLLIMQTCNIYYIKKHCMMNYTNKTIQILASRPLAVPNHSQDKTQTQLSIKTFSLFASSLASSLVTPAHLTRLKHKYLQVQYVGVSHEAGCTSMSSPGQSYTSFKTHL